MTGKFRDCLPLAGGEWVVSFITRDNPGELFDRLKDKDVSIDVKKASKGRSKDANAFCWALCSDIGRAFIPPVDKEDVYRMAIKAVGCYWQTEIPLFNLDDVRRKWEDRGTGWFLEVIDDSAPGRKLVHMYFGTSVYSSDEMRLVIDWLVDQMQQIGLPIPLSIAEENEMLERWGKK